MRPFQAYQIIEVLNHRLVLIVILLAIACRARGQTISEPSGSTTSRTLQVRAATTSLSFTRAVLIERYDEEGQWEEDSIQGNVITGDSVTLNWNSWSLFQRLERNGIRRLLLFTTLSVSRSL